MNTSIKIKNYQTSSHSLTPPPPSLHPYAENPPTLATLRLVSVRVVTSSEESADARDNAACISLHSNAGTQQTEDDITKNYRNSDTSEQFEKNNEEIKEDIKNKIAKMKIESKTKNTTKNTKIKNKIKRQAARKITEFGSHKPKNVVTQKKTHQFCQEPLPLTFKFKTLDRYMTPTVGKTCCQ